MADVVENRVVEMQFDNRDFERNVSTSLNTLGKLDEALKFKNSTRGFETLQQSIHKLDFSSMISSLSSVENGFMSLLGSLERNFFDAISRKILNVGSQLYSNTIGQIISGGKRRAMNIEQAQFKIKGLKGDWDALYEDMDYAVTGTAYGIDQAANAAAQFYASGIKAGDDMKSALRAISGVAAMTSSDYDEIARVFTAAAGKGRVMEFELNRIALRGINAAAALAKYFRVTEQELRDMVSKGKVSFYDFAKAMDDAFGEHAKKANETFTGSLSNMKAALSRIGEIFYEPWIRNMIPVFNRLKEVIDKIKNSLKSSDPEVETFATKLRDTMASAKDLFLLWTTTWEPGLKDFAERRVPLLIKTLDNIKTKFDSAAETIKKFKSLMGMVDETETKSVESLTKQEKAIVEAVLRGDYGNGADRIKSLEAQGYNYEKIQGYVNKVVSGEIKLSDIQNDLNNKTDESTEKMKRNTKVATAMAFAYKSIAEVYKIAQLVVQKFYKTIKAAKTAFLETDVITNSTQAILNFVQGISNLIRNFVIAGDRYKLLKDTFRGFYSIIDLVAWAINRLSIYWNIATSKMDKTKPIILTITGAIGRFITEIVNAIKSGNGLDELKNIFKIRFEEIKQIIFDVINLDNPFIGFFEKIVNKLKSFGSKLSGIFTKIIPKQDSDEPGFFERIISKIFGGGGKDKSKNEEALNKARQFIGLIGDFFLNILDIANRVLKNIGDAFDGIWLIFGNQATNLDGLLTSIFGFLIKLFDKLGDLLEHGANDGSALLDSVTLIFVTLAQTFADLREPFKEFMSLTNTFLKLLLILFARISDWAGKNPEEAYGAAAFFMIIALIKAIVDYKKLIAKKNDTAGFIKSITNLTNEVKNFFSEAKKAIKGWGSQEAFGKKWMRIMAGLLLMCVGFYIVMKALEDKNGEPVNPVAAIGAVLIIATFVGVVFWLIAKTKKLFNGASDFDMMAFGRYFMRLSLGIFLIMSAFAMTVSAIDKHGDTGGAAIAVGIMVVIIGAIDGLVAIMSKAATQLANPLVTRSFGSIAAVIFILGITMTSIMLSITGLITVLSLLYLTLDKEERGKALNSINVGLIIVGVIVVGVIGCIIGLVAVMKTMPKDSLGAILSLSVLLLAMSVAIPAIVISIAGMAAIINSMDPDAILLAFGGVIVIFAMVGVMLIALNKTMGSGSAKLILTAISLSVVLLTISAVMTNLVALVMTMKYAGITADDIRPMIQLLSVVGIILGILAGVGAVAGAVGFPAVAGIAAVGAMIFFVVSAFAQLGVAVAMLVQAFIALGLAWPSIKDIIPDLLQTMDDNVDNFIHIVGKLIRSLCGEIIMSAPMVAAAVVTLLATIILLTWQRVPAMALAFLMMFDELLDILIRGGSKILPKLIVLLFMLLEVLNNNAKVLGYYLGAILLKILDGAWKALKEWLSETAGPGVIQLISRLLKTIVLGVRFLNEWLFEFLPGKTGTLAKAIWNKFINFLFNPISEFTNTAIELLNSLGFDIDWRMPDLIDTSALQMDLDESADATERFYQEMNELWDDSDEKISYSPKVDMSNAEVETGSVFDSMKDSVSSQAKDIYSGLTEDDDSLSLFKKKGERDGDAYTDGFYEATKDMSTKNIIPGMPSGDYSKMLKNRNKTGTDFDITKAFGISAENVDLSGLSKQFTDKLDLGSGVDMSNINVANFNPDQLDVLNNSGFDMNSILGSGMPEWSSDMSSMDYSNALNSINGGSFGLSADRIDPQNQQNQTETINKLTTAVNSLIDTLGDTAVIPKDAKFNLSAVMDSEVVAKKVYPITELYKGQSTRNIKAGLATSKNA